MSPSPHRGLNMPLAFVREVSAVALALVVFLATLRLVRYPLLALPIAGLVYWGARSWIHRAAAGGSSPMGRHAARLRELAASLAPDSTGSASAGPGRPAAAGRLRALADELERLERKLENHPRQAVDADFFVEVQLPQAVDLVERYVQLAKTREPGGRVLSELRATEETLDLLLNALREQSSRFADQDLHEFAIDRRAFEELLRLDDICSAKASASDFRSESASQYPQG